MPPIFYYHWTFCFKTITENLKRLVVFKEVDGLGFAFKMSFNRKLNAVMK
ncbi:hypothetical protein Hanom_Chr08g00702041 [Helianthus anomalus]